MKLQRSLVAPLAVIAVLAGGSWRMVQAPPSQPKHCCTKSKHTEPVDAGCITDPLCLESTDCTGIPGTQGHRQTATCTFDDHPFHSCSLTAPFDSLVHYWGCDERTCDLESEDDGEECFWFDTEQVGSNRETIQECTGTLCPPQ